MRRSQFLVLCATAFAGCFLGGFIAQIGPASARAQYQTVPARPGQQTSPNIRNDTYLFIPEGGLRLINGQNRILGVITDQGGNGGITFLNSGGRPSVSISGGNNGMVILDGNAGPSLRFTDAMAKDVVNISGNQGKPSIKLKDGVSIGSESDGGRIVLSDVKGNNGLRFDTNSDGGRVTLYDRSHAMLGELSVKEGEGWLSLFNKAAQPGFQAGGDGSASVSHDKEVLWKIPADKN